MRVQPPPPVKLGYTKCSQQLAAVTPKIAGLWTHTLWNGQKNALSQKALHLKLKTFRFHKACCDSPSSSQWDLPTCYDRMRSF